MPMTRPDPETEEQEAEKKDAVSIATAKRMVVEFLKTSGIGV